MLCMSLSNTYSHYNRNVSQLRKQMFALFNHHPSIHCATRSTQDERKPRGTAQKVFSHVNRVWQGPRFTSYVGFGAQVDFGRHPGPTPEVFEDECINCALSYWGVWLKGGFSF